ncbi:MAG: DUF3592 domain-containing protein, partial [Planctomycetota bacterium]|nr:DUF3592 domain-containing protein [Planctomycetota bacterium]
RKGEIWVWEKTRFAHLDAGDMVDVVYHRKAPDVNKIFGAEPVGLPWWVPYLALTVSLLIGVPLLFFGSRGVAREIALLEYGALAEGRVVSVKILHYVNLGWNNHPVRVMVSFKDEFGEERSITAKTTTRNLTLKEKDRCRVLYDRGEPQRAVVVETLSTV